MTLYEKREQIGPGSFHNKIKKGFKGEILENEAIYQKEKSLKKGNVSKYKAGVLIYGDTNLNVYKFDQSLVSYLKSAFPDSFTVLTQTSHSHFLFRENSQKIIGVQTNKGPIAGDLFIVAAGNYSKFLLKPLGIRVPIIPVKGHALSVPVDKKKPLLTYNVTNDVTKIYMTQIADIYRLSGSADFHGMDFEMSPLRIKQLQEFIRDIISEELDFEHAEGWCCLRPVSADDVPIVSKVKDYENLYMNAGHGSKGLTLALGSGVLMRDLVLGQRGKLEAEDYDLRRFYLI